MKSKIACSYCGAVVALDLGEIVLKHRSVCQTAFKCPSCDSTTEVHIDTKRKTKGKKMRAIETDRGTRELVAIDARRTINKAAGDALLAEQGCTCTISAYGASVFRDRDGGHFLSTGWSREGDFMLPTAPQHRRDCPRYRLT